MLNSQNVVKKIKILNVNNSINFSMSDDIKVILKLYYNKVGNIYI